MYHLARSINLALLLVASLATPVQADQITDMVTYVRDGDTIVVGKQPIRLNGIAAPERNEPSGDEATAFMKRLVLGKKVTCTLNGDVSHDRLIGRCYLAERDIGRLIVAAGLARDCPRFSHQRYAGDEIAASRTLPFPGYCKVRF